MLTDLWKMLTELQASTLVSIFSFIIGIPDRILQLVWRVVLAIAPTESNIPIDVKSLSTWNLLAYQFTDESNDQWMNLMDACSKYQDFSKNKRWNEVQSNMSEVKRFTIKIFEEDSIGFKHVFLYGHILFRSCKSLLQFVKVQLSYKDLGRVVESLKKTQPEKKEVEM